MIKNDIIKKILTSKKGISVEKFIDISLFSKEGYYKNLRSIGKSGDFTTAPEISQLFGEIIALYILDLWNREFNKKINLIELGPGNGTLMLDILNTTKNNKKFQDNIRLSLVEKNNNLIEKQKIKLNAHNNINSFWYEDFKKIEPNTSIIIANEFFDCFSVRQFQKKDNKWHEKYINYDKIDKRFFFQNNEIKDNKTLSFLKQYQGKDILEFSESRQKYFNQICKYIYKNNGAIIIIDYGYYENNEGYTLQSIFNHKSSNVLDNIGNQDITSLVNFKNLINIAKKNHLQISNYSSQNEFLTTNGINKRKNMLINNCSPDDKKMIERSYQRLINENEMGFKFKILIIKKINKNV